MDDTAADGALFRIRANLGHDVVAQPGFVDQGALQIDLVLVRLQISDLIGSDQSRLGLSGRQRHPDPPPQPPPVDFAPDAAHVV